MGKSTASNLASLNNVDFSRYLQSVLQEMPTMTVDPYASSLYNLLVAALRAGREDRFKEVLSVLDLRKFGDRVPPEHMGIFFDVLKKIVIANIKNEFVYKYLFGQYFDQEPDRKKIATELFVDIVEKEFDADDTDDLARFMVMECHIFSENSYLDFVPGTVFGSPLRLTVFDRIVNLLMFNPKIFKTVWRCLEQCDDQDSSIRTKMFVVSVYNNKMDLVEWVLQCKMDLKKRGQDLLLWLARETNNADEIIATKDERFMMFKMLVLKGIDFHAIRAQLSAEELRGLKRYCDNDKVLKGLDLFVSDRYHGSLFRSFTNTAHCQNYDETEPLLARDKSRNDCDRV